MVLLSSTIFSYSTWRLSLNFFVRLVLAANLIQSLWERLCVGSESFLILRETSIIIPDLRHIVPVLTICRTHCPPVLPILRRLAGSPGRYHGAHHLEDNKLTRLTRRSLLVFEKSTSNTNQSFPVLTAQCGKNCPLSRIPLNLQSIPTCDTRDDKRSTM